MRKTTLGKHTDPEHSNLAPVENADSEIQRTLESSCLAELIWKYFGTEIREALLEAQESLADKTTNVQSS